MSSERMQDSLRRDDALARRLAQQEFDKPVVLTAGAGTGKTATLVARIVTWCVAAGWERAVAAETARDGEGGALRVAQRVLDGVVAITFTEAAAAEMAERVERVLDEIAQGGLPETLTELGAVSAAERALRASLLRGCADRLAVQTIHAWCRSLLRSFPVEAGLRPDFEVDPDGRVHRERVRELLDEFLRDAFADPGDPEILELAAHGFGPGEIEEALGVLLESEVDAETLAGDPLAAERIADAVTPLEARLRALVTACAGRLAACKRSRRAQQTTAALEATLRRLQTPPIDATSLAAFCDDLRDIWEERDLHCLGRWGRGSFGAEERALLEARAAEVAEAAGALLPDLRALLTCEPALLAPLHACLHALLCRAEAGVRARGVVSFQGLLDACARLLEGRPAVAAQIRRRIDQLLVDEFQDTDRRQCAIVGALALEGAASERPGLFLVGDPKQSIYGWRSADLAAYEGFLERVEAAGGVSRRLSVNHRSVPAVLDEVDRVMPAVMQARRGLQPAFEPLVASGRNAGLPGFCAGTCEPVEHWLPIEREADALRVTSLGEATRLESVALAADLRRIHDQHGVPWSAVGVLFRSRGDWDVYLAALREAGVPFNVEGDRSYYRRREIIDASALVRCVLDPEDHLALVAALRCSAVGVPDVALAPLWEGGFRERAAALPEPAAQEALRALCRRVVGALPAETPGLAQIEGWHHNLDRFLECLAELRRILWCEPGDVFVEALRTRTHFEVGEAGRFLGSWRAANLERFFCEVADWMGAGLPHGELLRRLRNAVAEEEPREEGRPRDLLPDAVSVLTLHGAKGMAFDHVYLMQLQKGSGRREDPVVARCIGGRAELRTHGVETLGFCRVRELRREVERFERARLLYVGMTRARQRLVMSWLPAAYRRGGRVAEEVLAGLVEQRVPAPPDLEALSRQCRASGEDRHQGQGGLWVLPAWGAPSAAPLREPAADAPPEVARVRADALHLARAATAASARMRRPLGGRASELTPPALPEPAREPGMGAARARAVGTLVHRVLERLDTALSPDAALDASTAQLAGAVALLPEADRHEVLEESVALLEGLRGGRLLSRLHALHDDIVGRELPLLAAPREPEPALCFVSGAIDLLYRDPDDGAIVVVDYKTDRARGLPSQAALEARAREHAAQGRVYQRAVQDALGLPQLPRLELWFLAHDALVKLGDAPELVARAEPTQAQQLALDFDA